MPTLTIPEDVFIRALKESAAANMDSLQMVTAKEAAGLLKLTPQAFREIATDHFNFGPHRTRWSLADIKALIEKRRIKSRS